MVDGGVAAVELLDPVLQRRQHLLFTALLENALSEVARPILGRLELIEELVGGSVFELGSLDEVAVLGGDTPDAAVRMVAARIAEIDLAVLDDRVVPIRDIDGAIGAHLDVDRAKRFMIRLAQLALLLRDVGGAVFLDDE